MERGSFWEAAGKGRTVLFVTGCTATQDANAGAESTKPILFLCDHARKRRNHHNHHTPPRACSQMRRARNKARIPGCLECGLCVLSLWTWIYYPLGSPWLHSSECLTWASSFPSSPLSSSPYYAHPHLHLCPHPPKMSPFRASTILIVLSNTTFENVLPSSYWIIHSPDIKLPTHLNL